MVSWLSWFSRMFGQSRNQGAESSAGLKDWPVGHPILDDFVVERELGEGGMGKVYLLRSRSTNQQFAVKRALLCGEYNRHNFLAELQTWIDLPVHPHLVACRFFRTVEDEIVIFAEFVERGSLETLIRQRQLTSLSSILDTAIQFAWGLHALHELGLVHEDVKPGNALAAADGLIKVTDFGLARARAKAEGTGSTPAGQNILVSCDGMTPAYCSPEQAQGLPLSRSTDIWSWGVSLLEMFIGKVTWRSGLAAPQVFKAYLKHPISCGQPPMPNDVAEVLQKCFRSKPNERWANLAEAAEALQHAYRQAVGKEYPRSKPAAPGPSRQAAIVYDRRTTKREFWDDPREWLDKAFEADGRDPAQVEAFLLPRGGSRKAQAIADLAVYEKALRIFERLVADGRKDLEPPFASLCLNKAFVHELTDDVPGALALYDRAITIYERLIEQEGRQELANHLANAYMDKALAVGDLGDKHAAVALYDRAISIRERLVEREGRRELANDLALACVNKAVVVSALGDGRTAVALYDRAIAIYEGLVEQEGRRELANDLANAYRNKAYAMCCLGDERTALTLFDRAISIRKRLVELEGRQELQGDLAQVLVGRAVTWLDLGDRQRARSDAQIAVPILEAEISRTGRTDLQRTLDFAMKKLRDVL